jgi:hypothetical protein
MSLFEVIWRVSTRQRWFLPAPLPSRLPAHADRIWTGCVAPNQRIVLAVTLALILQSTCAAAQITPATDPTIGFNRLFGLGGHTCKQYDDTGRLFIYSEGIPSTGVLSWLQRSDNGTKANVPMPEELVAALPLIPGCLPGKHHAASASS